MKRAFTASNQSWESSEQSSGFDPCTSSNSWTGPDLDIASSSARLSLCDKTLDYLSSSDALGPSFEFSMDSTGVWDLLLEAAATACSSASTEFVARATCPSLWTKWP